jgi:hypothetical protein
MSGIESEFRELFSEQVTLLPPVAVDKYGRRTHVAASAGSVAAAHIVAETKLSRDAEGRDVTETGRVYLYGDFNVTTEHLILLPNGASPVIIGVDTPHDEHGPHHTVVRVGN